MDDTTIMLPTLSQKLLHTNTNPVYEASSGKITSHVNSFNTSAQDPAIFALNQDLLWRIFSINANMDNDSYKFPALVTLQHTSQVCSSWRGLVLSSPSLWGRVIYLREFGQKEDDWRNEVMRRTGQSWLYVEGNTLNNVGRINLLESLLKHHWNRIKSLKIEVLGFSDVRIWEALLQPLPFLEAFGLSFNDPVPEILVNPKLPLFSDHAPSLHVLYASSFVSLQAPWIPQLRSLYLSDRFTSGQLLEAFAHMPLLETFSAPNNQLISPVGQDVSIQNVTLPRLTTISLLSLRDYRPDIVLLDNITPSPGCCLSLTLHLSAQISEEDAFRFHRVISRYWKNYSNPYPVSGASIECGIGSFKFESDPSPDAHRIFPSQIFYIYVSTASKLSDFTLSVLLKSLIPCFERLTTLTLRISEGGFLPSGSNFQDFASSLTMVEALRTTASTLQFLLKIPKDSPAMLPSLRILEFTRTWASDVIDIPSIFSFLKWRRELGLSICILELTTLKIDNLECKPQDFSCLEEFVGLEVLWRDGKQTKEYTCGSGSPEQLILSSM